MAEDWHHPLSQEARIAVLEVQVADFGKKLDNINTNLERLIEKDNQLIGVKGFIYFLVTVASSLGVGTFVGSHFIK